MSVLTSRDAQNRFGAVLEAAQKEPVTITRHDRPVAVLVSAERYAELEAMEDSIWAERAREASRNGFLGPEETSRRMKDILDGDA
ncbi:MAG: type II toxin-antitoxin system Phd/YefM family antitoxin [Candidatus Latescibacterota bacterium]